MQYYVTRSADPMHNKINPAFCNAGDMAITDVLKQKCSCQAEFMSLTPSQLLSFQSTLDSKPIIHEEKKEVAEDSLDSLPILSISSLFPEL